jgi:hypothetical protein
LLPLTLMAPFSSLNPTYFLWIERDLSSWLLPLALFCLTCKFRGLLIVLCVANIQVILHLWCFPLLSSSFCL